MTAAVGVVEGRKTLLAMDDKEEVLCAACVGVLMLLMLAAMSVERRSYNCKRRGTF
jgi:hypothetical protein